MTTRINNIIRIVIILTVISLSSIATAQNGFINTHVFNQQLRPDIAMNNAGETVIVWQSFGQDGSGNGIYGQRFDENRQPLGAEFQVSTMTQGDQSEPSVAMSDNGAFVVVWQGPDTSGAGIYGQRYDNNGMAAGGEFLINAVQTGQQRSPEVDMNASGEFVVVWENESLNTMNDEFTDIHVRRFDANGNQIGAEFMAHDDPYGRQIRPVVDLLDNGKFAIGWDGSGIIGTGYEVYIRRFLANNTPVQAGQIQVNTTTLHEQSQVQLTYFDDESLAVTWESFNVNYSESDVYVQFFDNTGSFVGTETKVNTYDVGRQSGHRMAGNSANDFLVIWKSVGTSPTNTGAFGQRYKNGLTYGTAFKVLPDSIDIGRTTPFVNSSGEYTIVSELKGDNAFETDKYGIYGQAFDTNGAPFMPVSTKSLYSETLFSFYPNPVLNQLTVENAVGQITIYNAVGQSVFSIQNTENSIEITIEHLPDGVYWIVVDNEKGRIARQLVKY